MRTKICDDFSIEVPIFAFSHSRRVVAEASRSGAMGVLGAVGLDTDRLDEALSFIDEHVDGRPYGVDILLPARSADTGTGDVSTLRDELRALIPDEHRRFVRDVLTEHGIEISPLDVAPREGGMVQTARASVLPLLDVVGSHPGVKLLVNALGPPPKDVATWAHDAGLKLGALAGARRHAELDIAAGADVIVAQGTEAGGHTGEIATMVLTPEIVEAVAPVPVLCAGGIGSGRQMAAALALGASGVWAGSLWLTTLEAETRPTTLERLLAARSTDTVRSRCQTGKPVRQLRSAWSEAWEGPDAPEPLDMPLQQLLVADALAEGAVGLQESGIAGPLVGQIVGRLNDVRATRDVIADLVRECEETVAGLQRAAEPAR